MSLSAVNKISLGFALTLLCVVVIGVSGIFSLHKLKAALDEIDQSVAPLVKQKAIIDKQFSKINLLAYQHYNGASLNKMQETRRLFDDVALSTKQEISKLDVLINALPKDEQQRFSLEPLKTTSQSAITKINQAMMLSQQSQQSLQTMAALQQPINTLQQQVAQSSDQLIAKYPTHNNILLPLKMTWLNGVGIAKRMLSVQSSDEMERLKQEFTLWLTNTNALLDRLFINGFNSKSPALLASLSKVSDLSYLIANEQGLIKTTQDALTLKTTLGQLLEQNEALLDAARKQIEALTNSLDNFSQSQKSNADKMISQAYMVLIIVAVMAVLIGVTLAVLSIKAIRQPLKHVDKVLSRMAEGDLSNQFDVVNERDEFGRLLSSISQLQSQLKSMLLSIQQQADNVYEAVTISRDNTAAVQANITSQEQQTDMVATATVEMTATCKDIAENTQATLSLIQTVSEGAQAGQQLVAANQHLNNKLAGDMSNSVEQIHQLDQQMNSISEVVHVINGITEQVNLLALNAAIEAARAGEHGRGFAVVANEVRNLALKTKSSTEQINQQINQLIVGSKSAVSAIGNAKQATSQSISMASELEGCVSSINETAIKAVDLNMEIAAATEQQSKTSEEIGRNVVTITELAKLTSSSSQQQYDDTEQLHSSAKHLGEVAKRFRF